MKTFLTAWLAEASKVLSCELAGKLELRPCAQLPQPETATTLAVTLAVPYSGRFLVTADRYALHALFVAARITNGDLDADRDREVWRGILHKIAAVTVASLDAAGVAAPSIAVEDAAWTLGLPSAAYELRFGETVMLVAFTDELHASQTSAAPEHAAENGSEPITASHPAAPPGTASAGIDLLLGVELEASLRFGSREMPLNEVLDLGAGDVVELDRHVSDPVDLLVGDKIVARGEVVLVNGSFGLRVLEVAEPKKRLESIRCLF